MSSAEIDQYLEGVPEPQRTVLEGLRASILTALPDAEQCISYQIPAFRIGRDVVAGFASFKNHMSYLPFSGSVLGRLEGELTQYSHSKSALRFTVATPLSDELVERLVAVRLEEIRERASRRH